MRQARLEAANLSGARLKNANLTGARLRQARLQGAQGLETVRVAWIDLGEDGQPQLLHAEEARRWLLTAASS
ncbi:pentapeptide repeat-containing protein [Thermogemmatispora sp.]|uniref:pentapeptide repeat-containing protein n=1 Tax=Thermogemmatispora sp. TaxID=1968838 RepID=UPI002602DF3B|nr:pentapeptide repeat-containing protein [Thermogemmatispora sp.]